MMSTRLAFVAGWVGAMAVESLYQDMLGKERYLRVAREHWITPWITVPLCAVGLAWALTTWVHARWSDG